MRVLLLVLVSVFVLGSVAAVFHFHVGGAFHGASKASCSVEDCAVAHTAASCANNCSSFAACSIDKNLAGARGIELRTYRSEKNTDGQTYDDWKAPDFTLTSTRGEEVSLSDYRGKPVAMMLFATHCNHCVDTVPIVSELRKRYQNTDLVVLPVVVNARSAADVRSWANASGADFPMLVSTDKKVAASYGTRLVPTTFLIDSEGYIRRKLVTFQDRKTLDLALSALVGTGAGGAGRGAR